MNQCYPTQLSTRSILLLPGTMAFTHEELDFIINYDIKYRMRLGVDSGAEDD